MISADGWVKLHRKLLDSPITTQFCLATKWVWIMCLLRANRRPSVWFDGVRQVEIPAGAFICGQDRFSAECGVSRQQLRTAFSNLQKNHSVTIKATNKHSLVIIENWTTYNSRKDDDNQQNNQQVTNGLTNKQPTDNQQVTTEEEYRSKNIEEEHTHTENVEIPRNGSARTVSYDSTTVAQRFEEFVRPWPTVADVDGAMRAWLSRVKSSDLEAAFACRDRYLQSDQVKRGVWTEPKKFINTQADSGWVGKWARAATANGISDADKELIAQVERDVESGRKTREERMKQKW